jgi:glycosyltransferase involved in cell wall biosynthesis
MKICQIAHVYHPDLVPDAFGAHDFAKRIIGTGNESCAVTWSFLRPCSVRETIDGVEIIRLRGANIKIPPAIREYPFLFGMTEAIRELRPDLIQAHSHLFLPSLQAIRIARAERIPIVVTIRGLIAERGPIVDAAQWAYIITVCKAFLPKADLVVCLTDYERNILASLGFNCEIEVIPNGVDTEVFKPGQSKDPYLITWVGRMVPEKGLEFLLRAMVLLQTEVPESRLVMIGDGPLMPQLREMADKLELGHACVFLGQMGVGDVSKILGSSSAFVLPSLSEGLPKALLEAMSCGNALIASDMPQLSGVVESGKDGTLVKMRDSAALADALGQLLQDQKLLRRFGLNARQKAVDVYSATRIVRRYLDAYSTLTVH